MLDVDGAGEEFAYINIVWLEKMNSLTPCFYSIFSWADGRKWFII